MINLSQNQNIGKYGESAAVTYLKKKGFLILARNLRLAEETVRGEIDILAIKDNDLHVVEVKSASILGATGSNWFPEDNLSSLKIRKLRKLRSILLMDIMEGNLQKVLHTKSQIHKVVITGIIVCFYRDINKGLSLKEQIYRVKVRIFPNL